MIDIKIVCEKGKIAEQVNIGVTTLQENALVIRKLEELKQNLLNIEYEDEFYAEEE
jgi:hypothetical protein